MKKYEIEVNINGAFTFEVKAKNKKDAQRKVDELLGDVSVKEALEKYRNNIVLNQTVKEQKEKER